MAEALGGKGKVAILTGSLVMANLTERMEGVNEVLAEKYPDIEVVDTIATDDDFAKGLDVSEAMLRAHPDLMELGRRLLGDEAAPALLARHRGALDRNELLNYTDWILRRVTCAVLHDPIARGVRDIMRTGDRVPTCPPETTVHAPV